MKTPLIAGVCAGALVFPACGAGEAVATWELTPEVKLTESSTTFPALVTRLGCNSGVTGQAVEPEISYGESEVVVTFTVTPGEPDSATCQGNNTVPFDVELDEPLEGRTLVDGGCLSGDAASTSSCTESTRYP